MIITAKQLEFHSSLNVKCKFKYYVSFHCLMSRLYWFAVFLNTLLFSTVRQQLYFPTHSKETLTHMTVFNNEHRRQCCNFSAAYLREHSPSRQFYTLTLN